ncbi:biotin--[acetyl-CoA-carboxylase] ligase [Rhodoligotrophos ferricapiens]|uniref:biotin--[acetyl-CoA-carboxylase] ligase n=1 Tax=Rhodoligotrophos ferricapiens TaxID=3069264 RepID=UPI00315DD376
MAGMPAMEAVADYMRPRLVVLDEIDSTNAEALRRGASGERGPVWLMAKRQTGGRGRYGRYWASEPGNLYTTLLMSAPAGNPHVANLSFVAALALYDALAEILDEAGRAKLRLKWPNDVLIAGAKTSGILLEAQPLPDQGLMSLALGFGVNISHRPEGALPYATTFIAEHGARVTPRELLDALMAHFAHWYGVWSEANTFQPIRAAWCSRAQGIGAPILVRFQNEAIEGIFEDLDEEGALILRLPDGGRRKVLAGDVFFR